MDMPTTLLVTVVPRKALDRKSTRLNSSHSQISYAVFCLKKKILNRVAGGILHDTIGAAALTVYLYCMYHTVHHERPKPRHDVSVLFIKAVHLRHLHVDSV